MKLLIIGLVGVVAAGCVTTPVIQEKEIVASDIIEPAGPAKQAYEYADTVLRDSMKDPEAMKLRAVDGAYRSRICNKLSGVEHYVYADAVEINGMNSYGAYTGWTTYLVYFKNGKAFAAMKVAGELEHTGTYLCPRGL